MKFWKNHAALRIFVIALLAILGVALTVIGWKMTGQLAGLGIMIVGMILLLTAIFVYNATYKN